MNAYAAYHDQRRDKLMKAARTLEQARKKTPGTVATMHDCVRLARHHNHMSLMHRNPHKHG